ncbi:MAG: F0F1 ATP synthase subunit B' [Hyphomicrobiales bacterium]|nr:MAG: F0F1 ATP synthase subunit B' [Hyphomicrobiales bacterium]
MPVRSSRLVRHGWAGLVASVLPATLLAGAAAAATPPLSGEKAAFPPFDVATFSGQLFWLAITFGALYWLMSTIALPRVGAILEERADTISRDLDNAAKMQAKAEETAQAYETALTEARKNAQAIAQASRDAGAKASDERRHAVGAELSAKLATAEATIATTKTSAMTNVRSLGSEVAIVIVTKLTGQAPSATEASEAVDQVLARG